MKLQNETKEFKSNVDQSDSIQYGIKDMGFVLDLLRNRLYSNKIRTPVQEYISNARDSVREAGLKNRIEIWFPTVADLKFAVRDYGVGLSPERLLDVFSQYGASTKRDSNVLTGGLGIGAKSAFAYTDSFTIESFYNGTKRTYVSHIGNDNRGQIDLMSEQPTTEQNGVKISYNVKRQDINEFAEAIIATTMFWTKEEYPVFHNSNDRKARLEQARKCGLTRFMNTNLSGVSDEGNWHDTGKHKLIVDGIPYPMPEINGLYEYGKLKGLVNSCSNNLNVFIPNGMVQVSASREKIDDSEFSRAGLKQVFTAAIEDFKKACDKWESEIVDIKSLLNAKCNHAGFVLSCKKKFDYLSFTRGNFSLDTHINKYKKDEVYLWRAIGIRGYNNRYPESNFSPVGEVKYYMLKPGVRSLKTIENHVNSNNKMDTANILIIQGLRKHTEEVTDSDGRKRTEHSWIKDEELFNELVETAERLGFVNIETVIPKPKPQPREKKERRPGSVYRISFSGYTDELYTSEEVEKLEKKGKWIYYVGAKNDIRYNNFVDKAKKLKEIGEFEYGFRVLEKHKKIVEEDERFIEQSEFFKNWVPSTKLIQRAVIYDELENKDLNILNNIIKNFKDKNNPIYKAAHVAESVSVSLNWETRTLIANTKSYNDIKKKVCKLVNITREYLPLLAYSVQVSDHHSEYIKWALDKAEQSGLDLHKLDIV